MSSGPLLAENDKVVLYDTVNSYYAGLVRVALAENNIDFVSRYVNMQAQENLEPWYMRLNAKGTIPALRTAAGDMVNESRNIVNWAYDSSESEGEKRVLDRLYSECPGSLAWLCGAAKIPLLKVLVKSPLASVMLPRIISKHQSDNPDLKEVYEEKLVALSQKHFTKRIEDVQARVQQVVDSLEAERMRSAAVSEGAWLLGAAYGRADAVATAYLQWVIRCNEHSEIVEQDNVWKIIKGSEP
eukprot:TRINITY_DN22020_c0_g1_i1.p1 TRINITY_DN22020_c0_g1~~TRINITY_DN22020_c0_g1_i1.p1  ORF type:complete len:242 (+),score=25.74 TRINITY_DN22020_c0_g1_i1:247-972(+)